MRRDPVSRGAVTRRLAVWVAFVAFCAVAMGDQPFQDLHLPGFPIVGNLIYFDLLIAAAFVFGFGTLLRVATDTRSGAARTMSRLVIAYLAYQVLVVIPVALWLATQPINVVLRQMEVRFTWLLLPVMLVVVADERARKVAGVVLVIAAWLLCAWGLYLWVSGTGQTYYYEEGAYRFRILWGGSVLLFAWPFALALSGAASRRWTLPMLAMSLVGLTLTNHRTGMIAFAVAGVALLLISGQARRFVPWVLPAILVGVIALLVWGQTLSNIFGYTFGSLLDVSSGNGADRLMRWRLATDFFVAHPINDYVWSWRYYLVNLSSTYPPHNFVLEIAVFEGLAGLLFYGGLLVTAVRRGWAWLGSDPLVRAVIGYIVIYLIFSFGNATIYQLATAPLLVGAFAMLAVRCDGLRQEDAERAAVPPTAAEALSGQA